MKRKMWAAALAASMVMTAFSGMTVSAAEADSDLSRNTYHLILVRRDKSSTGTGCI